MQEKIQQTIHSIVQVHSLSGIEANPNQKIIDEFCLIIPFDENSKDQLTKQVEQIHEISEKSDFPVDQFFQTVIDSAKLTDEDSAGFNKFGIDTTK